MSFQTPSSTLKTATNTDAPPSASAAQPPPSASSYNQLKDFSVESQRRMFIQEQERERQAAEFRRSSRRIRKASNSEAVVSGGLMSALEEEGKEMQSSGGRMARVGDDDDDSIADDWSLDSEESFYVGIERADYAQPNNLEMYGEEEKDASLELKEDRLGISRVSVKIIHRERDGGTVDNWDEDISPIHEQSTSLHQFMTGGGGDLRRGGSGVGQSKKDVMVAMPFVAKGIQYKGNRGYGEDDDTSSAQVYQQEAAEGKMFINKLVEGSSSNKHTNGNASDDTSTVADMVNQHSATTPARHHNQQQRKVDTPFTTPGAHTIKTVTINEASNYPILSPMALFSPFVGGNKTGMGEDNLTRQLRERMIRKDAEAEANAVLVEKIKSLQKLMISGGGDEGKVDASLLKEQLDKILLESER